MSIERYALDTGEMEVHRNGGYVLHTDYEELERYGRQADITIENLEQKLAESQREFRAADATIENLQMQVEKLAAENAILKKSEPAPFSKLMMEALDVYQAGADEVPELAMLSAYKKLRDGLKTPATDAFLAEVRAQGVAMFASKCKEESKRAHSSDARDSWWVSGENADDFASQLRKGVQS